MSDLKYVPISQIRTNPVALREVDREGESYTNLVTDVAKRGILKTLDVVERVDPATSEAFFLLVDGLHRYSAACDAGLEEVPVKVLSINDSEIIETQVVANLIKVDTKPVEYTKALQRMLAMNPLMTVRELAEKISQSESFVSQRFSLLKLDDSIQALVNDGDIKLANAYALAKLPKEHQSEWIDAAIAKLPSEFVPAVTARVKEIKEARRQGREVDGVQFTPVAKLRKLNELKAEQEHPQVGPALCAEAGLTTAAEGFGLGILWVLCLDENSLASAKAKWESQIKLREEEKKRRAAIRDEKRLREAAEKAAKAREEAGMSEEELATVLAEQDADETESE